MATANTARERETLRETAAAVVRQTQIDRLASAVAVECEVRGARATRKAADRVVASPQWITAAVVGPAL